MFDRLKRFLQALPGAQEDAGPGRDDPRVAAAAILVHLMDVDGERDASEFATLRATIGDAYGLEGEALDQVIAAGESADRDSVDFYAFTSVLTRALTTEDREAFVAMMWEMVYADNVLHELEDHVLWRIAELIGIDSERRIAIRRLVQERLGIDRIGKPRDAGA